MKMKDEKEKSTGTEGSQVVRVRRDLWEGSSQPQQSLSSGTNIVVELGKPAFVPLDGASVTENGGCQF